MPRSPGLNRNCLTLLRTGATHCSRSAGLRLLKVSQKGLSAILSFTFLVTFSRKFSSMRRVGSQSSVASLVAHRVMSAALNTSCVRIPQLSENISLNTARIASAIKVESPGRDSGLKPTGVSSAGLITTTSSARFTGIRSKIFVTRSAFGSSTKTLRPALMSARMRFSIAVDLPEPVGPRMIVCSSEASGEILNFWTFDGLRDSANVLS